MSQLPWAIEHGDLVWWATLGALLGLSFYRQTRRILRGAREQAKRARDGLGPAIGRATGLREGDTATLVGVFDAPSPYVQGPSESLARPVRNGSHAPFVWLGDVPVTLRGAMTVLAGHHARGGDVPVREVVPGRWVRVRGTLRRVPDEGGAGPYRESRSAWELVPDDTGAIRAASDDLPHGARFLDAALFYRMARNALLLLGVSAALGGAGLHMDSARGSELAAAVPFTRSEALRQYARTLPAASARSARDVERRLAVARLRHDCASEIDVAMEHGRLPEAQRAARACGLHRRAALALTADGRFEEASRAIDAAGETQAETAVQALLDADTHLLGGRDERAADALERAAEHTTREGLAMDLPPDAWNPRAESLRCAADALRARHGDPAARAHLALRARDGQPQCALLWADLLPPGEARRAMIETHARRGEHGAAWLLLSAEGDDSARWPMDAVNFASPAHPEALVLRPTEALSGAIPGLDAAVLARLMLRSPDARWAEVRAWLATREAVFQSAVGDGAVAMRWATQAAVDGAEFRHAHPEDESRDNTGLPEAIALRHGMTLRPPAIGLPRTGSSAARLRALESFARSASPDALLAMEPRLDATDAAGWRVAAGGDGAEFVREAQARSMSDEASPWMLLGARQLRDNRFALRAWTRWASVFRAWERDPGERAVLTANRMLLAEALHDDRAASELRERIGRTLHALTRRDIAVVRDVMGTR